MTTAQADGHEPMDHERADCGECRGSGTTARLLGPERVFDRCVSCGGTGRELSREDFLRLHDDVPEEGFRSHAEEIDFYFRKFRRAS